MGFELFNKPKKVNYHEVETTTPKPKVEFDDVNTPKHYIKGRRIQPAWAINDWGCSWNLGTCIKYISRLGRKDNSNKDIKKAFWYLVNEIALHYKDIPKEDLFDTINYIYSEEKKYEGIVHN